MNCKRLLVIFTLLLSLALPAQEVAGELAIVPTGGASTEIGQYLFFLKLIIIKRDESFKITIERLPEQRLKDLWQKSVLRSRKEITFTSSRFSRMPLCLPVRYIPSGMRLAGNSQNLFGIFRETCQVYLLTAPKD